MSLPSCPVPLTLVVAAGFLISIPALLHSNPQQRTGASQKAAAKPNPLEAHLSALEARSEKMNERLDVLTKLTEEQGKALEEADLRLTRSSNQLQEFATNATVKRVRDALTSLGSEVDSLKGQADDLTRIRLRTDELADSIKKVADLTEDLRRKASDYDGSDFKCKIDELRDLTQKLRDRQGELDRIGDKHEQRLNKLESKN